MVKLLIQNQWREMRRSSIWQRNLIINIFLGLFVLYFAAIFIVIGLASKELLNQFYPDSDPVVIFNGFLLLFFLADLLIRFFFDDLPTMAMEPLLHLPIKKNTIINYLLVRSMLSVFNFLPLLTFVPFTIRLLLPEYGAIGMTAWLVSIVAVIIVNNFLSAYLKRIFVRNMGFVGAFIGGLLLLGLLEYLDLIPLNSISATVWGSVLSFPVASLAFIAVAFATYMLNYQYIAKHNYLDEITLKKKQVAGDLRALDYLERFGEMGRLLMLELKLILRSKRPRTILIMGAAFVLYGGIFFPNPMYKDNWGFLTFASIFVTGGFAISYSQYFFAWESSYFDGILTQQIDLRKYLQAKFMMVGTAIFIAYLLSLFYGFLDLKFILLNKFNISIGN